MRSMNAQTRDRLLHRIKDKAGNIVYNISHHFEDERKFTDTYEMTMADLAIILRAMNRLKKAI